MRKTSGQRLLPPMPRSSACLKPAARTDSATPLMRGRWCTCCSVMYSQPSALRMIFWCTGSECHRLGSLAQSRRHGVYRVWPDQLVHVVGVRILGILRAGAGPEEPLYLGALRLERRKARAVTDLQELQVRDRGVGDGQLAHKTLQRSLLERIGLLFQLGLQQAVHQRVNPADEEAGDGRDLLQVAAPGGQLLEPRDVGPRDLLVHRDAEQQGH